MRAATLSYPIIRDQETFLFTGDVAKWQEVSPPLFLERPQATHWLAINTKGQGLGLSLPAPHGTASLEVQQDQATLRLLQHFDLSQDKTLHPGRPTTLSHRLHVPSPAELTSLAQEVAIEAQALTAEQFRVAPDVTF